MSLDFLTSLFSNLWAIFLIVVFFGGSIFVHELGHFLVARRRGVKVLRFSIGFGPAIWKRTAKDGVEYRLSWIPLGGYVALPQLADMPAVEGESEVEVANLPPISYTTKVLVLVAGAVFNVIFAFLLATVLWSVGRPEPENVTSTRIGYVIEKLALPDKTIVASPAARADLREGDNIVAIDGVPVHSWLDVLNGIVFGTRTDATGERISVFTIERNGVTRDFTINPIRSGEENFRKVGIDAAYAVLIKSVQPDSPGARLGLRPGDQLLAVDGKHVWGLPSLSAALSTTKGTAQVLTVQRGAAEARLPFVSPGAESTALFHGVEFTTNWQLLHQTPLAQVRMILTNTLQTFGALLHPSGDIGLQNLSGVIGIGRGFWDALKSDHPANFVLWFTVMINISLAFFNLLPIPVLDGGHILLATIAKLRGRPLPVNFILTTQSVFMVLLLVMMLYVTVFGDIRRLVNDYRADAQNKEAAAAQEKKAAEPAKP